METKTEMTIEELAEVVKRLRQGKQPSEPERLRYQIYVRKSTDDKEKQERSLGDQMAECELLAERYGLYTPYRPLQEAESAKEPNIRPYFREMMDNIIKGKLDGIIAWHPDRLARNMREAGEIIDLLDKGIIKDLRFASFSFTDTASGKTLLGMTFVMAKQFSDNLSDGVVRGNKRSLEEGKAISKAKTKVTSYFYYRCDTPGCPFVHKSVRANVPINFAISFLESNSEVSPAMYDSYKAEMQRKITERKKELDGKWRSVYGQQRAAEGVIEKMKRYLLDASDAQIKATYEDDLKTKQGQLAGFTEQLKKIEDEISGSDSMAVSYADFIELFASLPVRLRKAGTLEDMDFIVRQVFLNFTVTGNKITAFRLSTPFYQFMANEVILSGGR